MNDFAELFANDDTADFVARYRASCHCGAIKYAVSSDPVDAKICHCLMCQKLHGVPMQWAAIFHKHHVRFTAGIGQLKFYNGELNAAERILPCKISCAACGTPIADEGRNMWLAFPSLFDFGAPPHIPKAFKPTFHIFYGSRVFDMDDGLPKWSGHSGSSEHLA